MQFTSFAKRAIVAIAIAPMALWAPAAFAGGENAAKAADTAGKPSYEKILKGATAIEGVVPLYRKGSKLYAEMGPQQLGSEYLVLTSIARGIGKTPLLGGMTWGFDDDWVWSFKKVDDRIQIVRRNIRFRANHGSPESTAVTNAFTDSVLFSLPVITKGPHGGDLVDITKVFMSDLPQISHVLPGFSFAADRSHWAGVKGFKNNIELEVAATYASSGHVKIDTVADTRGVTIHVHYSISRLTPSDYRPRLADDRVGYFVTAVKDYSDNDGDDQFVRLINRWNVQKADPSVKLSPAKKPIVFWIEKTVPYKYRQPIREGIAEWNKAFEAAGILNAIEVRQQPDDASWDPEDINYNTFRWMTANAGFAMGPSRINPYTGEILDADIILDADFVKSWSKQIETLTQEDVAGMTGGALDIETYRRQQAEKSAAEHAHHCSNCQGMSHQLALVHSVLPLHAEGERLEELKETAVMQGLKEVVMHEVGHTLGLRHNFKASTFRSLEELQNRELTSQTGLAASVMDYLPTNIVPDKDKQGDYFSTTIGPYDIWAIQYGYTPLPGGPRGEVPLLQAIAARSGEPGLIFATDEDTRGIDPDPDANRFDLGNDLIGYARQRSELVRQLLPKVVERATSDGKGYQRVRPSLNNLLSIQGQAMHFAARYVGGVRMNRSHQGDAGAKNPAEIVTPAQQREALQLLEDSVFSDAAYEIPPELFNHMSPARWSHWGSDVADRSDFPVHETIALWQNRILDQLLSSLTLDRVADNELKTPADQDALTVAELISRLTQSIFSEVDAIQPGEYTARKPAISSLRRNLQRSYLKRVSHLVLQQPGDAAVVAAAQIGELRHSIDNLLAGKIELDIYTRSHLQDISLRIGKILDAGISKTA
ncbi:hypothetical protein CA54_22970 [Symmachiella macrocystis]|uniref:DUF5117 domain-containing protein n=1 Tax=Symmachiella macrocystis TaxID=2527985 RepID=A0A5C6BP43_9PLAN|nr:zinc-dependent metalloprotease [Symmachiella macrocystis]TWU13462.1 hypothetical protein CA54_22970 [Symmachiella macrocystis]